ncbi:MAG: alkaline phosphatase [Kiritimatiellae bacterium]|jgi:alkaline phosphatase|nr:alkaline phosphatase [Kiritimatiellia bacterium]
MSYAMFNVRTQTRLVFAFTAVIVFLQAGMLFGDASASAKPKYIFLMIGDGMGVSQRAVAAKFKELSCPDDPDLLMETFPVKGLTTTSPVLSGKTTDSAAAGTAMACGVKTKNGMIATTIDLKSHKSVAYAAKEKGMKVAIISSVGINHATPAVFYSTRLSRGMYNRIGSDIATSGFDFFAGEPLLGSKPDASRKLIEEAGYEIIKDLKMIRECDGRGKKILIEHSIAYRTDMNSDSLRLVDYVKVSLKALSDNQNGFFFMIEGGKVDWSGHANDIASNVGEVLDFDDAIKEVYEFYKKHPKETLIVVTGDHETGGLTFNFSGNFNPERFVKAITGQKKSGGALNSDLRKWKKEKVSVDEVTRRCFDAFGIDDATPEEFEKIKGIAQTVLTGSKGDKRSKELKKMYGNKNALLTACQSMVAQRCGVTWTTFGHSAASVKTTAIGVGSELFAGQTDNTDIGKNIFKLLE